MRFKEIIVRDKRDGFYGKGRRKIKRSRVLKVSGKF